MSSNSRNYASSSLADTPASPQKEENTADEHQLLTDLNINAQKITQQLNQMQKQVATPSKELSDSRRDQESESLSPLADS